MFPIVRVLAELALPIVPKSFRPIGKRLAVRRASKHFRHSSTAATVGRHRTRSARNARSEPTASSHSMS